MEPPVTVDGLSDRVSMSVEVTFARAGSAPDDVLREADAAMYDAKSRGKNRCEVFEPLGA